MDSQHTREMDKNRETDRNNPTRRGSETMTGTAPATGMASEGGASDGGSTMEQAKTIARNVGEQARNLGEQARTMASSATTTAQDLARRAREQTGAATETLYQQGTQASQYLTRNVNEYPLTALLIAGAIGYGLGYLIHSSWTGDGWSGEERRERSDRNAQRDRRD